MARRYKVSQSKKKKNQKIKNNTNCGCMKSKRKGSMRSKQRNTNRNLNTNTKFSMVLGRKQKQLSRKKSRQSRASRRYNLRRQRGGFFTDENPPTKACRGPSSIDMNSSDFQSIFAEKAPEPSSLTLDDMYYSFENSEGRQRFAPL